MGGFITPPNHINFLAKKLFAGMGEIIDGSIAYLDENGGGSRLAKFEDAYQDLQNSISELPEKLETLRAQGKVYSGNERQVGGARWQKGTGRIDLPKARRRVGGTGRYRTKLSAYQSAVRQYSLVRRCFDRRGFGS